MDVLVDFDNINNRDSRQGLPALAERIAAAIGAESLQADPRLRLRLYGGWFLGSQRSHRAQDLVADSRRNFPTTIKLRSNSGPLKVVTSVELAEALVAEPATPLHRTYRERTGTFDLRCKWPGAVGCVKNKDCPLAPLPAFFQSKRCPTDYCPVSADELLRRHEQKLTDTMLVCDLLYLAVDGARDCSIAVVSSDDDMLPGIRTAVNVGARVLQIHTDPARSTVTDYIRGLATGSYSQKVL
jgi:uncharacterized LabA/DUF88 family protein